MKILHISTSDRGGGAAIAAFRLVESMRNNGIDAKMLVLNKTSDASFVIPVESFKNKLYRFYIPIKIILYNLLRDFFVRPKLTFSCGISRTWGVVNNRIIKEADIIYIHWVQLGFLSVSDISRIILTNKPVFLVCHDMGYMTGGCSHAFDCLEWEKECRLCPLIGRKICKGIARRTLSKKLSEWTRDNVSLIVPSKWLYDYAKRSALFSNMQILKIPNTINSKVFRVLNRNICRDVMGLPKNKNLILFGAIAGTANPYKGWDFASKVMDSLKDEAELVVFGNTVNTYHKYSIHSVGKLTDESSLALLYNAVDVYISPTLAESFGQTLVESISCGTLVVAFNVGGVSDIIRHLDNGFLVDSNNLDMFLEGTRWALNSQVDENKRMIMHGYIEERFSYSVVANMHKTMIDALK